MRRQTTTIWMAASFAAALGIVVAFRLGLGSGERMTGALRATARWSFSLFWLATVGRALTILFGQPFRTLAAHARDFGLCYAAAHLAHVGLVVWIYIYAALHGTQAPSLNTLIFFGIGVVWTYAIALLSFEPFAARLDARTRHAVRSIGIEYIGLVFLVDFYKNPFQDGLAHIASYAPFVVLCAAGPVLRIAAAGKRLAERRRMAVSVRLESSGGT